jgi:SNF2 family DNA or RNA helicase
MMKLVSTEGLWEHQREYVEKFSIVPEHIQLWEPRTGKTRASCKGFVRAILEENVFRVLITGPKTGCREVWANDEVPKALAELPDDMPRKIVCLLDISGNERRQILHRLVEERSYRIAEGAPPQIEVIIINRDMLDPLLAPLLKWNPQYVIIDELHKFKHAGSLRSRAAFKIARQARFRRGLTGTPAARDLRDIYGQWKIIAPSIFGTNKAAFEERYCVFPPSKWQTKVASYRNVEELQTKAFSIATIFRRKDCFDIPEVQDVPRLITLPKAARSVYDNIVREHILELEDAAIPMTHTLSRMMQLRQIAIGYARYDKDGGRETEWLHTAKIEETAEEIDDVVAAGKKIIVFHSFHPEGYALHNYLKHLGIPSELINGKILGTKRSSIIREFQNSSLPVVIVQEETASESISLTAADYTIFLSHGSSADTHKQASDRSFKPQNAAGTIKLVRIYPRVKGTIEVSLYNAVKQKLSLEEQLLSGPRRDAFWSIAYGETSFNS